MTVADAKAALARGRPVVLVRPPAVERAPEVWELVGSLAPARGAPGTPAVLLVCPDHEAAADWAAAAPTPVPVHAVSGLGRSVHVLKQGAVNVLAGAPKDLTALAGRAALKLNQVTTVVLAWPEALVGGEQADALDTVLAEARQAQRIVLSWNPAALGNWLERHAHRALVVGTPAGEGAPLPPVCRARYALVPSWRRSVALRDALDALQAANPFVWEGGPVSPPPTPCDAVVCMRLPSRAELAALAPLGDPIVFVTASQLPYLRSLATLTPLVLPSAADRARDRAEALRERVTELLSTRGVDAELALLDPLFERFDPAEVAAALLAVLGEGARVQGGEPAAEPAEHAPVKVFVNVGRRDRVAAKDLVGALIREAGVAKADIGRIEVRETFSLVEIAAAAAAQAVRGLSGVAIRGRRAMARRDRQA